MPDYPILEIVEKIKSVFDNHYKLIIQAPPGAGKSTILPLKLLHEKWLKGKKVIMLEPRRLAARSVAARMASLLGEEVGKQVGYRIRFEKMVSKETRIEVVTDGIFNRMLQQDNALEEVGLVLFDEFHERSLQVDFALALTVQCQQILRPDLRIGIMSATLETEVIERAMDSCPVVTCEGKQFPVEIIYEEPAREDSIALAVFRLLKKIKNQEGGILTFLPGAGEILKVYELIKKEGWTKNAFPLYGDLPFQQQQEALSGKGIILATSIAETSLTIEGITTVVDCGYARVSKFNPNTGLSGLETVRITHDAATQRTGRAGRLSKGVCYRLWSPATHHQLQPSRAPEIISADLSPLVLELAMLGIYNPKELLWITSPPLFAFKQSAELLEKLEAFEDGKISEKGKAMAALGTHPRLAHVLLAKEKSLAADVAAVLEERDPMRNAGADLSERIEVLRRWRKGEAVAADISILKRIDRVCRHWQKLLLVKEDNTPPDPYKIGNLIAQAYPDRIAKQESKNGARYKLSSGGMAELMSHDSLVREPWLAVAQMDSRLSGGKIFLAAPLNPDDVKQMIKERRQVRWDSERGLVATVDEGIGHLIFKSKPLAKISEEDRNAVLCEVVRTEGEQLLRWDDVEQWRARILSLKHWGNDVPDFSLKYLLAEPEEWLTPFLQSVNNKNDFQRLPLRDILSSQMSWETLKKLDECAPDSVEVPSGSSIRLHYCEDGSSPILKVRLQEVFGMLETPMVNKGKVKILMHLLSPGYKPVQITQDMRSFWTTTYHEVRKELRIRYPRHEWPENPWTAQAVRGIKRKRD